MTDLPSQLRALADEMRADCCCPNCGDEWPHDCMHRVHVVGYPDLVCHDCAVEIELDVDAENNRWDCLPETWRVS